MKLKKIFTAIAIVLCIIFPATILTACGKNEQDTVWGKDFKYQGQISQNLYGHGGQNGSKYIDLLKSEFVKGNLDLANSTINGIKVDMSNASALSFENFVEMLKSKAKEYFDTNYAGKVYVKVGSKEESVVTINQETYKISLGANGAISILDTKNENLKIGSINEYLLTNVNGTEVDNCLGISFDKFSYNNNSDLSISIPTHEIVDDESAGKNIDADGTTVLSTCINLQYFALLSEVK